MLWDLNDPKQLNTFPCGDPINALVFSPIRYWLCAATSSSIKIFDLEHRNILDELRPDFGSVGKKSTDPECVSLAWSSDGQVLFAGYTDGIIRVYEVMASA